LQLIINNKNIFNKNTTNRQTIKLFAISTSNIFDTSKKTTNK